MAAYILRPKGLKRMVKACYCWPKCATFKTATPTPSRWLPQWGLAKA